MRKFLITMMCIIMVVCFMPTVAMAETGHVQTGYGTDTLPTGPDMSGDVINVNADNIQYTLDGAYGSIDGKTIVLSGGNYGKIELGRATKYPGSNTNYYIGGVSEGNKKTYEEFVEIKNSGQWSASAYYVRNMNNVTIKAADGASVTVQGITGTSGHVYGNCYDYVLDKAYTSGSAYYLTQNWHNITIEGITFTAPANIASSLNTTVIDGVTFRNCTFNINNTASGNQALRYYNENNDGNVRNLTVENCSFNTCFQGVYTQKINGVTVMNSYFYTTGHNAIAVQSGSGAVDHKAVIITGNTFNNIGDRIIRFGDVGADTQIIIKNNTATHSGDSSGDVMKAQSLAEGVTYDICGNNWGAGKTVANGELNDKSAVATINGLQYTSLQEAIASATNGQTVTLLNDIKLTEKLTINKNLIIDGNNNKIYATEDILDNSRKKDHLMLLEADVTLKNVTLDSANKAKGINTYGNDKSLQIYFENVKMLNSAGNGLTAKGGTVTMKNVAISGSAWKQSVDISASNGYNNGANLVVDRYCSFGDQGAVVFDNPGDETKVGTVISSDPSRLIVSSADETKDWANNGSSYTKRVFTLTKVSTGGITTQTAPTDNVTNSGSTAADNAATNADLSNTTSTSNGTTTATVDKTTADKIVDKAVENKSKEVVIDATANTTTAANSTTIAQVTIPTETLGAIAEKTEADVTIKTDVAEVKMDNAAATAISEQATGDTVQIVAEKVAEETDKVEFKLKVVCSDGKVISNFNGGKIAVTVALPKEMAEKKVVCVYIDDNGHMSKVEGQKNADGTYTFVTGHFSSYAIMAEEEADAAIAAQKEAIKNIEIKLTSKQVKTKSGKKGIKITWTAAAGDKVLDGVEVYRSTERYKGYGTEPFYTSTKRGNEGSYINTKSLKKGTRYYYRVRGYVLVDGQKVYTDYSTKAWRTVK